MLLVSIWALGYGFELSSQSLDTMLFWIKIEYIGISFAPAAWFWFCLKYTGLEKWINSKTAVLIFTLPLVTYLLVLSNSYHNLHYKEVLVDYSGPFPLLNITIGPWYFIHTAFFYLSLIFGNILLLVRFKNADSLYKKQSNLLIIAGFVPWAFNIVYLLGFRPFGHIDLTPYALLFSYIFIGIGLLKFDLFDLKPIARDKVFELITKGILVLDPKERVIDFNKPLLKILNNPGYPLIGKSIAEVFGQNHIIDTHLKKREKVSFELSMDVNETKMYYSVNIMPIFNKKNIFRGAIILMVDISSQKEDQNKLQQQAEELRKTNSLKDKLFTIISHDLKGPILGVRELIKLTNDGVISRDEFFDILPEVNRNMDSVSVLLENLLAWTSSQLKGEMIEKSVFNLESLIQQQFSLFEKTASQKGIRLKMEKFGETDVYADKNMIDLTIRNLISNAMKFSGANDVISVIMKEKESEVYIKVKDTGAGIDPENLQKLRNKESITTLGKNKESGTGLGLLLVQEYIAKNGGKLYIQSFLNEGSDFSFYLPKFSENQSRPDKNDKVSTPSA
jgi:signal transduction histidine kinase